jgi:histidinol-phosphate aminotransferase
LGLVHEWLLRFVNSSSNHETVRGNVVIKARLDLNESPYSPSPKVLDAIAREAVRLNRYPEPELKRSLEERLAEYSGVKPENVIVSCGADLILQNLFQAVASPGSNAIVPFPAFFAYDRMFGVIGVNVKRVKLEEKGDEWVLNIGEIVNFTRKDEKAKLVVIDNPNNPTGSLLLKSESDALEIVENAYERNILVVFDEAYYEFSGVSFADLVESYENVVIVRTMSKAFSLAGARLGYAIMHKKLAAIMRAMLPPFPPRLSLVAGLAALEDLDYSRRMINLIVSERERVRKELNSIPGVKAYKSYTNFLLVKTPIENVVEKLLENGVAVRGVPLGSEWFRASIGSSEENEIFIETLKSLIDLESLRT